MNQSFVYMIIIEAAGDIDIFHFSTKVSNFFFFFIVVKVIELMLDIFGMIPRIS